MGLRQVLVQETIRAIALGYVVFVLMAVVRNSLGLSGNQIVTLSGLATLGVFLTFTAIRLRTGWELVARTRREWIIVGMVAAVVLVGSIGVVAIAGQQPRLLGLGPLSPIVPVLVLVLFVWLGYRSTRRRR